MKILQIVPSVSLVYGGPSQMIRGLCQALTEAGVSVTLITTDSNGDVGQPPLDVPLAQPVQEAGYEVWYFRCTPFRRYKFSWSMLRWLGIHGKHYDLAHIHALFSPISTVAAMVARWQNLPYILRPLGTLDPADLAKKKRLKQLYGKYLEGPNLAGAAAIHFTSTEECRISHRFGTQTTDVVVPLGINPPSSLPTSGAARQHLGIPDDRPLLLFLSRIEPKKGLDLLIPALEQLLAQGKSFHFVLAGSNPQDPEYEKGIHQQIGRSPLADCTAIPGFVTGDLKLSLLQDADVFVLPSYYENFGIAVAEAMALGTPVAISDRVQIWPEIRQANAGWVCPQRLTSLQATLQEVLENPAQAQERGKNARQLVEQRYLWPQVAQQMIAVYETCLSEAIGPNWRRSQRSR